MRVKQKPIYGTIDSNGKLQFCKAELDAFCKLHPGRNIIMRVEVMPILSSKKTQAYYYGYVLPTVTRAFYETGERLTEQQCDKRLRELCPSIGETVYNPAEGWVKRTPLIECMDKADANEFVEWVKEFAAENLCCIINDP